MFRGAGHTEEFLRFEEIMLLYSGPHSFLRERGREREREGRREIKRRGEERERGGEKSHKN